MQVILFPKLKQYSVFISQYKITVFINYNASYPPNSGKVNKNAIRPAAQKPTATKKVLDGAVPYRRK